MGLIDPNAAADEFRGVKHEVLVETGHQFPRIIGVDEPHDMEPETLQQELDKLSDEISTEYKEMSDASDTALTPEQEAKLIKLLETHNRTEALRFMGIAPPDEIADN